MVLLLLLLVVVVVVVVAVVEMLLSLLMLLSLVLLADVVVLTVTAIAGGVAVVAVVEMLLSLLALKSVPSFDSIALLILCCCCCCCCCSSNKLAHCKCNWFRGLSAFFRRSVLSGLGGVAIESDRSKLASIRGEVAIAVAFNKLLQLSTLGGVMMAPGLNKCCAAWYC